MADFSRQYCEAFDSELPWDFDINEEFAHLEPDTMVNLICEGFGFVAIGKSAGGELLLAEVVEDQPEDIDENSQLIQWRTLDEFIETAKNRRS